ncbi:hypothetical protein PoB_007337000 [Plakobranchus ocellatus]|uniref:Uncharacterized protein n=1 Tax=Plakobranchus ocellatus TaxID=259542 RepID=A0AAV4DS94_9GAST|nr:hypothetical protein PoB_007337000 [Plakobranchus ocellatus]
MLLLQIRPGLKSLPQFVTSDHSNSFSTNRYVETSRFPALPSACGWKLSNLNRCITSRLDTCHKANVKKSVRIRKDIYEYICSGEGKPVHRRFRPCNCFDELETCWILKITNLCNADIATFIANIWKIKLVDLYASYECPHSIIQSRRSVKRELPMVSKRLAAISKLKLKRPDKRYAYES